MITSPFNLKEQVSKPDSRFDTVPLLDLCLIGLFAALYSSRFIFAPGLTIDLPRAQEERLSGLPTTAVLTIHDNSMILFKGQIFRMETLQPQLAAFLEEKQVRDAVLLLKVHKTVDAQQILQICDLARQSGFARVQLAAQKRAPVKAFLSPQSEGQP